eukprot:m.167054 g.167054  ORF g.167054 m.167054 type:complete len:636 (+) comp12772_c0_seq1:217-2124(+)
MAKPKLKKTTGKGANRAHGKVRKGVKGEASQYMSRTVAVRKLQLSLPDFRRLCILKGVYPREPRKKKVVGKGNPASKTYYHTKDIKFLLHEPLINKFREFKIFLRKLKKAVAKKDRTAEERLLSARPTLKIDHLIKERYPTMIDAVRDLDDALCMVFLFAQMPQAHKVQNHTVARCRRLSHEFQQFVVRTHALEKVFLSIKGIYYRATILGQPVTWISPYKFSIRIPTDVDFRVMDTFLLFYTKLLGFVNYSLYTSQNLQYPPRIDETREKNDNGLSALILEPANGGKGTTDVTSTSLPSTAPVPAKKDDKLKARIASLPKVLPDIERKTASDAAKEQVGGEDDDQGRVLGDVEDPTALDAFPDQMEGGEEAIENIEEAKRLAAEREKFATLFKGLYFFVGREAPRYSLEFVIPAFGGAVSWEGMGDVGAGPYSVDDKRITHQIVDRPTVASMRVDRHYVQPQWVYDCINCQRLLPTAPYTVGAVLPPHQSPFGDEGQDPNFVPADPTTLDDVDVGVDDEGEEEAVEDNGEGDESDEDEALYRQELEAETGTKTKPVTPKASKKKTVKKKTPEEKMEEETKELAKSMMSKKDARLYKQIMHGRKKKEEEKAVLMRKRKAAAKEKASGERSSKKAR